MTTPEDPFGSRPVEPGSPAPEPPPVWGAPPQPGYGPPPAPVTGYGQAPAYGGQDPAYGGGYGQETSSRAIVALVLAIGSFVVFPLVPAIVAVVLASGARAEIDASGGRLGGDGLVTAARIVAWINIAFFGLLVLLFILAIVAFGVLGFSTS